MAKIQIDLSGAGGLAPGFAGDLNDTTAKPHLRYQGGESQVADGLYDPLRTFGYISPANNTFADLTGTITNPFISRAYCPSADTLYLAQNGAVLSTLDGLDDTSITNETVLPGTSVFKDLEMYEVNGFEALFFAYKYADAAVSEVPLINVGWKAVDSSEGAFQLASRVYETYELSDTMFETITSTTNRKLAQKFRSQDFGLANSLQVSGIRLALKMPYPGTTQVWSLKASIQTDSAGFPSGTDVTNATATIAASTLPVGGVDFVFFDFGQLVTLTADTTYHIVLEPTVFGDLGANEGVQWLSTDGETTLYEDGRTERYNGTSWEECTPNSEDSFDFALITNRYLYAGHEASDVLINKNYVTIGTTANNRTGGATTLSVSQTVSAFRDPCVLVALAVYNTSDVLTSMTLGGQAMTLVSKSETDAGVANRWMYVYRMVGVSAGSQTIEATISASSAMTLLSVAYYGVDQDSPIPTGLSTNGSGGSATYNVSVSSSPTGSMPFAVVNAENQSGSTSIGVAAAATDTAERVENATDTYTSIFDFSDEVNTVPSVTATMELATNAGTANWFVMAGYLAPSDGAETETTVPAFVETSDESVFLKKADNGLLYIFANSDVHKFDGGTTGGNVGVMTPQVLAFPKYIKCVDAIDTQSLMYIAIQSTSTNEGNKTFPADVIGLYEWDRQSTAVNIRNFLPAYGAREIKKVFVNAAGELRVITIGGDRFTEIRGIVQGRLVVLKRLGLSSYPVYRDGVDLMDNMNVWLGADGIVYALGRLPGSATENVFKIGSIAAEVSGTLTSGILAAGHESSGASLQGVFLSWADNANTLTKWYPHGTGTINSVAQKGHQGDVYSLVQFIPPNSTVDSIDIYGVPTSSAGATVVATIKPYFNQSSTAWASKSVKQSDAAKGVFHIPVGKSYVNAVQIEVEFSTTQTLGADDYRPVMAVVNYTVGKAVNKPA